MSEDRMQGIPRWRPFRNLSGLAPDKNGEWVRYADASRVLQKLRDALERYGSHLENCALMNTRGFQLDEDVAIACDCGYSAALREAK